MRERPCPRGRCVGMIIIWMSTVVPNETVAALGTHSRHLLRFPASLPLLFIARLSADCRVADPDRLRDSSSSFLGK